MARAAGGGYSPQGGDWLDDEVVGWRGAGLDLVVSLLEPDEAARLELAREADVAESKGVRFISFPIPDRGVPASAQAARSLIKSIVEALDQGRSVAVHCRQGVGRSGLIASGVLVASGIVAEQAISAVTAARGEQVPETSEQLEWIRLLPAGNLVASRD